MLSVAGADHIITMDLHASQIQVLLFVLIVVVFDCGAGDCGGGDFGDLCFVISVQIRYMMTNDHVDDTFLGLL